MTRHSSPGDRHAAAEDERARLALVSRLQGHEDTVRERERQRILAHMLPEDWPQLDTTGFAPGAVT